MKIGKRDFGKFIRALFAREHYEALIKIFLVCQNPLDCFKRYFLGLGSYPTKITIRTPLKKISPKIYSYYDMLTINEIFCRIDYKAHNKIKTVVDIGSNIGISALYFLTRNNYCKCYLFEPDFKNVIKLNKNLQEYEDRYVLKECAVATETGIKEFGRDLLGRCGGLNRKTGDYIKVKCCHINDVLSDILSLENRIDILKIDIEGDEIDVLRSIKEEFLNKINIIYFEIDHTVNLDSSFSFHTEIFSHKRRGETFVLTNKSKKEGMSLYPYI